MALFGLFALTSAVYFVGSYLPKMRSVDLLDERVQAAEARLERLTSSVRELRARARALEGDPFTIELHLRRLMGWGRPGEKRLEVPGRTHGKRGGPHARRTRSG